MRNRCRYGLLRYGLPGIISLLVSSGCFAPRFEAPLEYTRLPDIPVAVVPVTPEQVRMNLNLPQPADNQKCYWGGNIIKDRIEVAKAVNSVLDSLAAGEGNPLLGPQKLRDRTKDTAFWDTVYVYLNDPGEKTEPWKVKGLSKLFMDIGIDRIVIVATTVEASPTDSASSPGTASIDWDGKIIIVAKLITLSPFAVLGSDKEEANFFGSIGLVGGGAAAIPYAIGKTFERAADQALREALKKILEKSTEINRLQ